MFWSLVKHEMRRRINDQDDTNKRARKWLLPTIIIGVLLFVTLLSLLLRNQPFQVDEGWENAWYMFIGLPFVGFGMSFQAMDREWKGQTWSWWLSIPLKRSLLIFAKWLGSFIKTLQIFGWAFLAMILLFTYLMFLQSAWERTEWMDFVQLGFRWLLVAILLLPLLNSFGTLLALLIHTRWSPMIAPISVLFWGCWGAAFAFLGLGQQLLPQLKAMPFWLIPWELAGSFLSIYVISFCMVWFASYLLKHKLI